MSRAWKIRPLLLAALIFALMGAAIGGLLSIKAVSALSTMATQNGEFERAWSNANLTDLRASNAARFFIATGNQDDYDNFISLSSQRVEKLLEARELAPELSDNKILERTYHATIGMNDIEEVAVNLAKTGNYIGASKLLSDERYGLLGTTKMRLKEQARGLLVSAINGQVKNAKFVLVMGLISLMASLVMAAICWWKVGKLFQDQARELAVARDTLAEYAGNLEQKIEIRTRDLEAAKIMAESADHAKSAFLAQMSHEIRTPMNGILGMADALGKTRLNQKQRQLIEVIQESGDTLLALLNDVLDLAKIEAGHLEVENIDFSVAEVAKSAETIFQAKAHEKGLEFSVQIEDSADIWCTGDPTRIKQILYNLVSNAIKFTEEGYVCVAVKGERILENRISLEVTVSDSGIGIDEVGQARLFKKFSQADAATTRKYGGTGLGLAICKELASLMGGDIIHSSKPGEGSVFNFVFEAPIVITPTKKDTETLVENIASISEKQIEEIRILAAEDNANNRLVLKMFLEQVGIYPTFVENGALALEAWKTQEFDIILMDVQMPIMSGSDATIEIRKLEAQTGRRRTPIIALTANAMSHHVRECLEAGMDKHVAKPIQPDILFSAIDEALTEVEAFQQSNAANSL